MNAVLAWTQKIPPPCDRDGIAEDAQVHRTVAAGRENPALELFDEAVNGLRPDRILDHDVSGASRESKRLQSFREGRPEGIEISLRDLLCEEKTVILIGADGLFAASLRAHDDEAALFPNGPRSHQIEKLGQKIPVQVGGYLRDDVDLDALLVKTLNLALNVLGRDRQVCDRSSSVDAPGDQLRVPCEEFQNIYIFKDTGVGFALTDRNPALFAARHGEQRLENEIVAIDGGHLKMADVAHRRFERHAAQYNRLGDVHAGDDASSFAVRYEQGIGRRCAASHGPLARWWTLRQ